MKAHGLRERLQSPWVLGALNDDMAISDWRSPCDRNGSRPHRVFRGNERYSGLGLSVVIALEYRHLSRGWIA